MVVLLELVLTGIMALWDSSQCFWLLLIFISGDGPGHSTLVFKGCVHSMWCGDSNGRFVLMAVLFLLLPYG